MAVFRKYRCKCQTEDAYVYWLKTDEDPVPTACPNDTEHTLDPADTWTVVEQYSHVLPLQSDGSLKTLANVYTLGKTYYQWWFEIEIPANQDGPLVTQLLVKNEADANVLLEMLGGFIHVNENGRIGDLIDVFVVPSDEKRYVSGLRVRPGIETMFKAYRQDTILAGDPIHVRYTPKDAFNANPVKVTGYIEGYK